MSAGDETLRFPGMLRWLVLVCAVGPAVMAGVLWAAGARSPWQLAAPFVPFLVTGAWVAHTHAREVVLTAAGTLRVTTALGRRAEAPVDRVATRWARVPAAAAYELVLELPGGPDVRLFQYPHAHTRRLAALLERGAGADS